MPVTGIIQSAAGGAFDPADLFASSEDGAWHDPSDLSTLWKDTAGTDPVTADGDAVARMDDKSGNGHHLMQATAAARPLYKTSGALHWLQFDGVDDHIFSTSDIGIAAAVVAAQVDTGTPYVAGLLTQPDGTGGDFRFALVKVGNDWYFEDSAGGSVSTSSHVWNNQVQTVAITYDAPRIYSVDATGRTGVTYQFPTGMQIGRDRTFTDRHLLGRVYGVIIRGTPILTTAERNDAEEWLADKSGVTL